MKDQHRLFLRFSISFIGVLAIALGVILAGYQRTLAASEKKVHEQLTSQLRNNVARLESRFEEVADKASTLSLNSNIIELLKFGPDYLPTKIGTIRETFNAMGTYNLTNSFAREYFVFFERSELLLSTSHIALDLERYYDGFLRYDGLVFADWRRKLIADIQPVWPAAKIHVSADAAAISAMTFRLRIPTGRASANSGVIFALIDEQRIVEILESPPFSSGRSWLRVYDHTGQLLASKGGENEALDPFYSRIATVTNGSIVSVGEERAAHYTSTATGWTYVVKIPIHYLASETKIVRDLLLLSVAALLLLGLALSGFLAWRQSRPFAQVIGRLRNQGEISAGSRGVLKSLADRLSKVIDDRKAFEAELLKVQPHLRRSFLDRLISGRFSDEESMRELMAQADVTFDSESFRIYLFALAYDSGQARLHLNTNVMISSLIGTTLAQVWGKDGLVIDVGSTKLALVVRTDGASASRYTAMYGAIDAAENAVDSLQGATLMCGESRHFQRLLDASLYYEELSRVMEYNMFRDKLPFIRADEYATLQDDCLYPLNQEQRLLNLAKSGNFEEGIALIRTIIDHNCHTLKLSPNGISELKHEMIGTMHKVRRSLIGMGIPVAEEILATQLRTCEAAGSEEAFTESIIDAYEQVCGAVRNNRLDARTRLVVLAKAYIDDTYSDPNLCLQSVADYLDVSPKYLSRSFSYADSATFSDYLEFVRMEEALRSLKESAQNTAEIAENIGYLSSNTFFKAFKRRYGVTPSEWRFQNRGDKIDSGAAADSSAG